MLKGQAELAPDRKDAARATFEQAIAEGEALAENARPLGFTRQARKALEGLSLQSVTVAPPSTTSTSPVT